MTLGRKRRTVNSGSLELAGTGPDAGLETVAVILGPLGLTEVNDHASAIDVADAHAQDLGDARPRGVGGHEDGPMAEAGEAVEEASDFVEAQAFSDQDQSWENQEEYEARFRSAYSVIMDMIRTRAMRRRSLHRANPSRHSPEGGIMSKSVGSHRPSVARCTGEAVERSADGLC